VIDGSLSQNKRIDRFFKIFALLATIAGLLVLSALIIDILSDGLGRINWSFLTNFPSRKPEKAGILSAIVGTLWVMGLTALFSFPIGVCAGIYLEEYARKNFFTKLIEVNIANLAGVPSIIYGLLGLGIFVRTLGFERSVLSGALTLTLLILPIIIQVLPVAMPGVMTGTILALSRAIGETAPLIAIGALTYIAFLPESVFDPFTVLPIQTFNWISRPQKGFATNAAAAIIVLLLLTLIMNSVAIYLRHRFQRGIKW
jgi:phosphate transport system permease protein